MALENVMDGNEDGSALYHLDNLCYEVFKCIPTLKEERSLFRFTGLNSKGEDEGDKWDGEKCYAFNDLKEGRLTYGAPKRFNDPMDPLIKAWAEERRIHFDDSIDKRLYQLINKSLDKIRISCLIDPLRNRWNRLFSSTSVHDCNPLMWAHYANSHQGICIQYTIKPVNQISENNKIIRLLDVNYDKSFPLDGDISFENSLCVKGNFWKYEKETRLILFSREKLNDYYSQE